MLDHTKYPSPTWRKSGLMVALLLAASLLLAMGSSAASAQEMLEVGEGKEYATIQLAIHRAKSGDTILVYPGTYTWIESVVIKKALTVKSVEGAENTIIDFTTCSKNFRISINHSNFTLDGFTVVGRGDGFAVKGEFVIRIKGQKEPTENVSILNNVLIGISGIDLESAAGPITGVTIAGNTFKNCNYGVRVKAIFSGGAPADPIENVDIENNNIGKSFWPGHSVRNYAEAAVDATMNWWGTKVKSEIDEMVTEDSGEIIVDPWLDAPYPEGVAMSGGGPNPYSPPALVFLIPVFYVLGLLLIPICWISRKGAEGLNIKSVAAIVTCLIVGLAMLPVIISLIGG